jgi:hypothetical protein
MGKVACAYDNSVIESSFGSMQMALLDRRALGDIHGPRRIAPYPAFRGHGPHHSQKNGIELR